MTVEEIKAAVANGDRVCWKQTNYEVIHDALGQFLIRCTNNGNCTGLHSIDGILNGKESEFYVEGKEGKCI